MSTALLNELQRAKLALDAAGVPCLFSDADGCLQPASLSDRIALLAESREHYFKSSTEAYGEMNRAGVPWWDPAGKCHSLAEGVGLLAADRDVWKARAEQAEEARDGWMRLAVEWSSDEDGWCDR